MSERAGVKPFYPERTAGRVFVEVGCGPNPVPKIGAMKFTGDDQYIGVDLGFQDLYGRGNAADSVRKRYDSAGIAGDCNAEFLQWSGEALPLPDHSADEVLFANVAGEPIIDRARHKYLRDTRNQAWEAGGRIGRPEAKTAADLITLQRLFEEASRVLKDDGQLTILETITPLDISLLYGLLRLSNFALQGADGFLTSRNPDWERVAAPYAIKPKESLLIGSPSYIAFARKRIK